MIRTRLAAVALVGLLGGGLAAAPVPKGAGKTPAERLLGRWEMVKSRGETPENRHVIVFGKDGELTLEVQLAPNAAPLRYAGRFTATKAAIDYELAVEGGRKAEKLDVKKLTDDELVTTDPDGVEEQFKRLKDK
jgi:uncharacterized protein (TIGR03066 family)